MSVAALAGQKLAGLYHLKTVVAHGAHGVVFEAQHVFHGTRHAVKVFYPEAAESGALARCRRDADMAAALHDPGIVRVAEWSRPELLPTAYLVMDFVEGENVQSRVRRLGRLTPQAALELGLRVGQALTAAHKLGVVHRGLTPRNLLYVPVSPSSVSASSSPPPASATSASATSVPLLLSSASAAEEMQILDFGVAHLPARPDLLLMQAPYLAPEVLRGEEGDQRSDQYSLAAVLYEALTGRRPPLPAPLQQPDGADEIELLPHDHEEEVPPLGVLCPEAPAHLVAAIERAMSPSQGKRYASMGDFTRALDDRGPIPWYRAASVASSVLSARSALSQGSAGSVGRGSQGSVGRASQGSVGRASQGSVGRSGRSGEPGGGVGRSAASASSTSAERLRLLEEAREAQALARSQGSVKSPGAGSEALGQASARSSAQTPSRGSTQTPGKAAGLSTSGQSASKISGPMSSRTSGPTSSGQSASKVSGPMPSRTSGPTSFGQTPGKAAGATTSGQTPSKSSGQLPSRTSVSNPLRRPSAASQPEAALNHLGASRFASDQGDASRFANDQGDASEAPQGTGPSQWSTGRTSPAAGAAALAAEGSKRSHGRADGPAQRTDSVHSLSPVTVNGQQRRGRRMWGVALGSGLVLAGLIYLVRAPHSATLSPGGAEQRALQAQGRAVSQPAPAPQPAAPPAQPVDPKLRLLDAQAALGRGEHSRAIELAKGALPSPQAWQVIALAACQMGNQSLADEALQQLGPAEQARVRLDCIKP